jgi:hypothetical protein
LTKLHYRDYCSNDDAFVGACRNGHLNVVEWMYACDPTVLNNYIFINFNYWLNPASPYQGETLLSSNIPPHIIFWLLSLKVFQQDTLNKNLSEKYYTMAFTLGYKPDKYYYKLYPAYTEYRDQLFSEIRESKYQSPTTTIFEIRGLPEMILDYV